MEQEKIQPQPLSGQEVQEAILYKVAESLSKTCHLHPDNAYAKFRADISIRLVLSDFGREQKDNHEVSAGEDTGLEGVEHQVDASVVMEPQAPNAVRVETNQDVPVSTVVDGKTVTRKVRYAARKAVKP